MNNVVTHLKLFSVAVIWGLGWPAGRVVANDILPLLHHGSGMSLLL